MNDSKKLLRKLGSIKDAVVRTRNYDKAINELDKLLMVYPSSIDTLRLKGNILDLKASEMAYISCDSSCDAVYDEALSCYDQILSLDPDNTVAHIDKAGYWLRKQEYSLALSDCDKAINVLKAGNYFLSRKDELEEAYCYKVEILEELGKEDDALAVKVEMQQQLENAS